MKDFTREETLDLLSKIRAAINKVAEEEGFSYNIKNPKFGEDITGKLIINKLSDTDYGTFPSTQESRNFTGYARGLGLNPKLLFETIQTSEGAMVITGYSTRRPKYPISYTLNGKNFKAAVQRVKQLVGTAKQEYLV